MGAGLEGSWTTQPGQGKAYVHLGRMRSLVAEAHHMLIAGVRLGARVAAVVRISIAIFHCGIHTEFPIATIAGRTPHPNSPHPGPRRRPSLTALQFLTLAVTAVPRSKRCVHLQRPRSARFRHGGCVTYRARVHPPPPGCGLPQARPPRAFLKELVLYGRTLLHPSLFRHPVGLLLSRPHPRGQASAGKRHKPPPTLLHPDGSRHAADISGPLSPLAVSCLSSVPTAPDRCPTQLSYPDALGMTVSPCHPTPSLVSFYPSNTPIPG